jgi:hypothetical protein
VEKKRHDQRRLRRAFFDVESRDEEAALLGDLEALTDRMLRKGAAIVLVDMLEDPPGGTSPVQLLSLRIAISVLRGESVSVEFPE